MSFKSNIRIFNIENFRRTIDNDEGNIYFFIGKTDSWPDEQNPPATDESDQGFFDIRQNMHSMKKVSLADTCFVLPRVDWKSGTVYDQYEYEEVMEGKNFYVMTDQFRVYKCLDNNDGAESTSKPTSTGVDAFTLADGYRWKFMYNLSQTIQDAFLFANWMPVPTGDQKTSLQENVESAANSDGDSPVEGHGGDAVREFFVSYAVVSVTISDADEDTIPIDDFSYRQYGLWLNPRATTGDLATNSIYLLDDSNINIDMTSGYIIHGVNRTPVERAPEQTDRISTIISF